MTERRRQKLDQRRLEDEKEQKELVDKIVKIVQRGKCTKPAGMFCLTCTVPMSAIFHGGDIAGKCSFDYFKRGVALWNIIKTDMKRGNNPTDISIIPLVEQELIKIGVLKDGE